jgi:TolA-binding protein
LNYYKKVVDEYPNSHEAQTALDGIKDIYMDMGNVDEYFAYIDSKKFGSVSTDDRDSLSFTAAERLYILGDCNAAITSMEKYLQDFPVGKYLSQANYYIGDCYYRNEKLAEAAKFLENIVNKSSQNLSEEMQNQALDKYARAKYLTDDFEAAAKAFEKIANQSADKKAIAEAQLFSMRAYNKVSDLEKTIEMATKVADNSSNNDETIREALIAKARALQELDKTDEAIAVFKTLADKPQTAEGAEATYNIIENLYVSGKAGEAENMIYKFSESKSPQASWLARSFIVLANIYIDKKDYFQAKATLNSIIENYKGSNNDILQEAKDALEMIKDK